METPGPDLIDDAPTPILYGYTKALDHQDGEETNRRIITLGLAATTYNVVTPLEVFTEPDNGQLAQFHRLVGTIQFHRQNGNDQPIIVIVYERRDTGKAMWQQLWAENRLNEQNAKLVFT